MIDHVLIGVVVVTCVLCWACLIYARRVASAATDRARDCYRRGFQHGSALFDKPKELEGE